MARQRRDPSQASIKMIIGVLGTNMLVQQCWSRKGRVTFCCRSTTRRAATGADSTIGSLRKHSRRLNTCFTVFDGVKERQAAAAPCC